MSVYPYRNTKELCQWLKDNSSGSYRPTAYASEMIESLVGERDLAQTELNDLSKRFTALIQQNSALAADNERLEAETTKLLYDLAQTKMELIRACAELSGIKKQEPAGYLVRSAFYKSKESAEKNARYITENYENVEAEPLFAKPVHQHSFTLSGIGTFYADSGLEITYLERLHGVGGKANLKAVDEEHF